MIIKEHNPTFSNSTTNDLTIRVDEIAGYDRVVCMVQTQQRKSYDPIMVYLPPDVVEESPDLSIKLYDLKDVEASIQVNTTIPCFVWCVSFPADQESPDVKEMKRVKPVFIRNKKIVTFQHLIPSSSYKAYCYSESPLSSPMKYSIQSTEVKYTTKPSIPSKKSIDILQFENIEIVNDVLSFAVSIPSKCILNNQSITLSDSVYSIPLQPNHNYYLMCKSIESLDTSSMSIITYSFSTNSNQSSFNYIAIGIVCVLIVIIIGIIIINKCSGVKYSKNYHSH